MNQKEQLIFEKWITPINNEIGTIRITPGNYYVASVYSNKTIIFRDIETYTSNINRNFVIQWANEHLKTL